jgi:SRSO17 transposase
MRAAMSGVQSSQWLLIEWPANDKEPSKYFLSMLPEDTPIAELVSTAHQRWCVERDHRALKQDFGLGHDEGRGWRGFHHHAALSIAAYGFLMAERLVADKPVGGKKTSSNARCLPFPRITFPAAVLRAQRHGATSITSLRQRLSCQLIARLGQCPCCGRESA